MQDILTTLDTASSTVDSAALIALASRIRDHQLKFDLSDAALCKRYAGLGSTKTFKRILENDLSELNIERQTRNYTEVLQMIEMDARTAPNPCPFYEDFSAATRARLAVQEAFQETGNDRLVLIQAGTGAGKTEICQMIARKFPNAAVLLQANETWKNGNNPNAMIRDIYNALQLPDTLGGSNRQLAAIITACNARKRILIFDEGHHMSPPCLNVVKTLINCTISIFVISAFETLFTRMESRAYQEVRQLTQNRLYERVKLGQPDHKEIAIFLERRGVQFITPELADKAAHHLATAAPSRGNWKFVNLVSKRARANSNGKPIDQEQLIEAVNQVIATR